MLLVVVATTFLIDGTAYLVPFLLGMAFIAAWGAQAVAAYRAALRRQGATPPPGPHSPAAAVAWLAVPLLAWGTLFWIAGADSGSSSAVLDRFLSRWSQIAADPAAVGELADDAQELSRDAAAAIETLRGLCRAGVVPGDCDATLRALGRDLRFRVVRSSDERATAVLEVVRFERRPSRFLGIFEGTQIIAVPHEPLLRLRLAAEPEDGPASLVGARRWRIVASFAVPSWVEARATLPQH